MLLSIFKNKTNVLFVLLFASFFCTAQTKEIHLNKAKIKEYYILYSTKYDKVINGYGRTIVLQDHYKIDFEDSKITIQLDEYLGDTRQKLHKKYTFDLLKIDSLEKGSVQEVEYKREPPIEGLNEVLLVSYSIGFHDSNAKIRADYTLPDGTVETNYLDYVELQIFPLTFNGEKIEEFDEVEIVKNFKSLIADMKEFYKSKKE